MATFPRRVFLFIFLSFLVVAGCQSNASYPDGESRYESFAPDGIPFVVADSTWAIDQRGNHRAVVSVADPSVGAVVARLPWRRPDLRPEIKRVLVTDAEDNEIKDVTVTELTSERGEVIFNPSSGKGQYFIYYLPFKWQTWFNNVSDYLPPEYEAGKEWKEKVISQKDNLPQATVERFESALRFHFWSPMGLIATKDEMEAVRSASGKDMIVFPEDRAFPIQLTRQLPVRWTKVPESVFKGLAMRNEYYTWQFGIWAAGKELKNVRVSFSELKNGSYVIKPEEITCFNLEGTSWDGSHLEFTVDVPKDRIQALWCGVQIPEDAKSGTYEGQAVISAEGVDPQTIKLEIKVSPKVLADKGDSEVWRHARLRWLNSTLAMDNEPVGPYKEVELKGNVVEATGKRVTVGGNGMVQDVNIDGIAVLNSPQRLIISTKSGDLVFNSDNLEIHKDAAGLVSWTASSEQEGINFALKGNMEFDGHMHFDINVSSAEDVEVQDVRLVTTYSPYSSEYFMGAGFDGGYRPVNHVWKWEGPYDSYWTGGIKAGMHTEFRGGTYHGPLLFAYTPDPSPVWSNGGSGKLTVSGPKGQSASVIASTGRRIIGKEPINFEFNLMLTPAKPVDPAKHFSMRFFHANPKDFDKAAEDGANIMNIHHAQGLNPYINYPFIVREPLINFINHEHENGRKVKLYYTMRELSSHCEEMYAFHSLNHEIIREGPGEGNAWLCEHLIEDYLPQWYTNLSDWNKWDSDAAIHLVSESRYINYFIEGLRWMVEHYDIDGLYMDDVACDRTTIKRVRKILDRYHDGSLIDLHSNTWYSKGPANQYTEFFPYLDRIWFGESFQYDKMSPDEWLVTFSGIPFGVMSEMLQDGGNRYLGMVYGTTARHSWTDTGDKKSPVPMWKFWDKFGIGNAKMVGYWDPDCPVSISDPEVKATAYVKEDSVLVSIGNFSDRDKNVTLNIDWKALGMDPAKAKITAPEVHNFQAERSFDEPRMTGGVRIPVESKKGWMILISE